jgi:asparagine synthase (glutamine-hydrolysing)
MSTTASMLPTNVRQKSFRRRLKRLLETLSQDPERRYLNWISIFNRDKLQELVSDDLWELTEQQDPAQHIFNSYQLCPNRDFVTRTTATDLVSYLPGDLLTKVDIASMSTSLECRSPMLDHKVMELAARMPLEVKQSLNQGKRVLIETFSDLIPPDIQTRKKMGFGVPIDHWFRNELKNLLYDVLLSQRATDRGLLQRDVVQRLIDEHTTGVFDHAYRLWNLLCLELWQRMYLDEPPPAAAPNSL